MTGNFETAHTQTPYTSKVRCWFIWGCCELKNVVEHWKSKNMSCMISRSERQGEVYKHQPHSSAQPTSNTPAPLNHLAFLNSKFIEILKVLRALELWDMRVLTPTADLRDPRALTWPLANTNRHDKLTVDYAVKSIKFSISTPILCFKIVKGSSLKRKIIAGIPVIWLGCVTDYCLFTISQKYNSSKTWFLKNEKKIIGKP